MPIPPPSIEAIKQMIAEVERALGEGFAPLGANNFKSVRSSLVVAADRLGCTRQTLYSRLLLGERLYGLTVDWTKFNAEKAKANILPDVGPMDPLIVRPPPREATADELKEMVRLRDENSRLRKTLEASMRDQIDMEAIRQILGGMASADVEKPTWMIKEPKTGKTPHVPVTIWSDWHCGEVVSPTETNGINSFNIEVFETRVKRLVEKTIYLARNYGPGNYPGIVVGLLGDFVSGALHPELMKSDEEEVIPSALRVRDTLVWALEALLDEFKYVYCPCTAGNHGRNTMKPQFKRQVFENFDWLIYQLLSRHFRTTKNIVFDIPESNEVHFAVFGQRYLAMHGDQLGVKGGDGIIGSAGPILRGSMKVGKQASAMGRDFDYLIMGHWHQPLWLPGVIVAGTLKGWDEYAQKALRAPPAIPSQPLWFCAPKQGIVSRLEIYLEQNTNVQDAKWVSWADLG